MEREAIGQRPTLAQRDVLLLLAQQHSNVEIGNILNKSPETVKNQVYALGRKLNTCTRIEIVRRALNTGLLEPKDLMPEHEIPPLLNRIDALPDEDRHLLSLYGYDGSIRSVQSALRAEHGKAPYKSTLSMRYARLRLILGNVTIAGLLYNYYTDQSRMQAETPPVSQTVQTVLTKVTDEFNATSVTGFIRPEQVLNPKIKRVATLEARGLSILLLRRKGMSWQDISKTFRMHPSDAFKALNDIAGRMNGDRSYRVFVSELHRDMSREKSQR